MPARIVGVTRPVAKCSVFFCTAMRLSPAGVVQETLALSQTRHYGTGGTMHLVINNQIGFTTSDPRDYRSTLYCTDIAKMAEVPIFHVNADDPEACLLVTEIAMDYRTIFHKDVFIDLVCFRRLGHNEQDEPMVTQPLMYKKRFISIRVRASSMPTSSRPKVSSRRARRPVRHCLPRCDGQGYAYQQDYPFQLRCAVPAGLGEVCRSCLDRYRRYHGASEDAQGSGQEAHHDAGWLHPASARREDDWRSQGHGRGQTATRWGMAENLAYATLVNEGTGVRLSGEDCGRGTFSHRHAVFHDQNREKWDSGSYIPLQHVNPKQGEFTVIDSILSEEAVLGFEYGYSTSSRTSWSSGRRSSVTLPMARRS